MWSGPLDQARKDSDPRPERDTQFLAACKVGIERGLLRRREDDFLDRTIGTDSNMIGTADVDGCRDDLSHARGWGRVGEATRKCRREIHTEISAAIRQGFENVVRFVAGMRIDRGTAGMGDQHRFR